MYQRGKHSLFIGRAVVRVGMEIEVGMAHWDIESTVNPHRRPVALVKKVECWF
jgi:hypothetical protein